MKIIHSRRFVIVLVGFMLFFLPILCVPALGLSAVLLASALLIIVRIAEMQVEEHQDRETWMDAQWHPVEGTDQSRKKKRK